ncbi:OLC1v1023385C1 [Oldenlandia corymbosa var. corymbosa]|uniref:OLC1v1023385C1 n=1 Tax=Oldenlandia corymbosa var. corymbosa TaxID=529605 RepID=A0AAV1C0B6_OLDCO|nr:OLC1v1023385C1 [Oldenlandia corymbosa var. corymbosa]
MLYYQQRLIRVPPGIKCYSTQVISGNSKIAYYARVGQIYNAREVFDELPRKSISSWNSIVSGYFNNNLPDEARRLFDRMPERNLVSWNGLISGFIRNNMLSEARKVFDEMPERNVVSWTAMVRGYLDNGLVAGAEALFWKMPERNVVSWTVMLGGLIQEGRMEDAKRIYEMMPEKDVVARTSMIGGLCQEGLLDEARELFDSMPRRNVFSWTAMISGYAHNGKVDLGRKLFEVMPEKNEVSWSAILMGYINNGRIQEALELFESMPSQPIFACNSMILGLGQTGDVKGARRIFDSMRSKDDATWSAMVKVYERKGFELDALDIFRSMQWQRVKLNFPSLISVLTVCASLASLDHGRQIHANLLRSNFEDDVYCSSVLITMYMKCGDLMKAKQVFDRFSAKDVVMWNAIITGCAQHGLAEETLKLFHDMLSQGYEPDNVTFIGVLSACSYTGNIKEGKEIFEAMRSRYLVEPSNEHYACMVDMLGRAGRLSEAMDMINNMPMEPDAIIWGSFMGSCRNHMNQDLAELAARKLLQLEPENAGPYILLSNIFASKGKWRDVGKLRKNMRLRKVSKSPGCSWIEFDKKVHMFTGGENTPHPEHQLLIKKLEELSPLIKEAGYVPDGSFVLHDLDDEEKARSLGHHSEKLAVAYGLLKLPEGAPIRVMKNLRVCGDCHAAIKLISKVTGRYIILRDANRFHHFKDGICSCNDYW